MVRHSGCRTRTSRECHSQSSKAKLFLLRCLRNRLASCKTLRHIKATIALVGCAEHFTTSTRPCRVLALSRGEYQVLPPRRRQSYDVYRSSNDDNSHLTIFQLALVADCNRDSFACHGSCRGCDFTYRW